MADIFKEVEEDLRRDTAAAAWKKYGPLIVGLALVVVLGVGGLQAWRAYDLDRRSKLSDEYALAMSAIAKGDTAAAQAALDSLSDATAGGYRGLAAFEQAQLLATSGDTSAAIAIWDKLAEDTALGSGLQNAATLLSVLHQIDTGDPQTLRTRMEPLTAPGQAYRAAAVEFSALLAMRQGDREAARELYSSIADDREVPAGVRARAAQMLAALKG